MIFNLHGGWCCWLHLAQFLSIQSQFLPVPLPYEYVVWQYGLVLNSMNFLRSTGSGFCASRTWECRPGKAWVNCCAHITSSLLRACRCNFHTLVAPQGVHSLGSPSFQRCPYSGRFIAGPVINSKVISPVSLAEVVLNHQNTITYSCPVSRFYLNPLVSYSFPPLIQNSAGGLEMWNRSLTTDKAETSFITFPVYVFPDQSLLKRDPHLNISYFFTPPIVSSLKPPFVSYDLM